MPGSLAPFASIAITKVGAPTRSPDGDRDEWETASVLATDSNFRGFFVREAGPTSAACN